VSAVISAARAAVLILEAAESAGLPMPFDVTVNDFGPVALQFRTVDELTMWCQYADTRAEEVPHEGYAHRRAHAVILGQSVRLAVCIRAEVLA
jgi:hypothetical protein